MAVKPDRIVLDRLDRDLIAWLCTVRPDGSPHLIPVWFLFRDHAWWISSAAASRKVRNLAADPRVSLALESAGTAPVVAEGRARIHQEPFPREVVSGFKGKYGGWDITLPVSPGSPRVLLEVPVTRWLLAGEAQ